MTFSPILILCAALLGLGLSNPAQAHKGSDAYLEVQSADVPASASADKTLRAQSQRSYQLALSVAIKDLDLAVPMDANADGQVTWGEIKTAMPLVLQLVNQSATFDASTGQPSSCRLDWAFDGLEQRSDGAYVKLMAKSQCVSTKPLALRYELFKAQDANHRLLVAGRIGGNALLTYTSAQQTVPLLLAAQQVQAQGANAANASLTANVEASGWHVLFDYALLGMHHLLEGYDHLAFLLALVLPLQLKLGSALAVRPATTGISGVSRASGWLALLSTVTAFTLGHSITLALATLGWTQASPVWVEPVIALSIGVTAWLNLYPVKLLRSDVLALLFGLVHGFGFAGLLQEAAAPQGLLLYALTGFNLGVEAGQLMAVIAWVLLSQLVVAQPWYQSGVVRRGSQLLMLLAAFWFWQRVA